jgi:hypothetical protein
VTTVCSPQLCFNSMHSECSFGAGTFRIANFIFLVMSLLLSNILLSLTFFLKTK